MREMLFRAKKKVDDEWVEGNLFIPDLQTAETQICIGTPIIRISFNVIPETVGQFTGLTDKNGKKIFEGDIIQTVRKGTKKEKLYQFVIKYGEYIPKHYCRVDYCQYKTIGFYAFDGKDEFQLSSHTKNIEVIGNIHDNPEFLKKKR